MSEPVCDDVHVWRLPRWVVGRQGAVDRERELESLARVRKRVYFASVLANSPLHNVSGPVRDEDDVKIADDRMLRRSIDALLRSVTTGLEVGSSSVRSAAACREG